MLKTAPRLLPERCSAMVLLVLLVSRHPRLGLLWGLVGLAASTPALW